MDLGVILSEERIAQSRAAGWWPDRLILDYLDDALAARPDHAAIVDNNSMTGRSTTLSWRQLDRLSRRFALALAAAGIGRGDVVAWQLPNWWQFTALHLACVRIGAISNPLMPIFRERELTYMLGFAGAKVFIVPRFFRGHDYPAMVRAMRPNLPALAHSWTVGGEGEDAFERHFVERRWEDEPDAAARLAAGRPEPDDVVEVLYTSGTTGQPKGVMHTSNTLFGNILGYAERLGLSSRDIMLMASPMAHQTGFLYGMLMPIVLGSKAVLQDIWNAETAARLIADERVTWTMGATPFLADLTHTPALQRYDIASLEVFLSAGAPIPRILVQQATEKLKCAVLSGWGMTENGAVTTTLRDDSPEKAFGTDGGPIRGSEVRVVDESGAPAPLGEEGDLQTRGAGQFVGYLRRPEAWDTDAEGWFKTGDRARMDADGYIRIVGRSKDIIIRGGENVPVAEVEELLYRHPAVRDAAVVGMPDERLGERGCAVVTLKEGASLDFAAMLRHLQEQHMARNYLPEDLVVLEEMPRTPSGKIQKFKLRDLVKERTAARG